MAPQLSTLPVYAKSLPSLSSPSWKSSFGMILHQRRPRQLLVLLFIINAFALFALYSNSSFSLSPSSLAHNPSPQNSASGSLHPPTGKHYVVDMFGVNSLALATLEDDPSFAKIKGAIKAAGMSLLGSTYHKFENGGVTAVFLLAESHVSIHTWPEHRFVAIDVYTCGLGKPARIVHMFERFLRPESVKKTLVERGVNRHSFRGKRPLTPERLAAEEDEDDDEDDEDEDLDEFPYNQPGMNQPSGSGTLPPAPPPVRSTDPRDLTFPRGKDIYGNSLADICVNGDDIDDDCYLLRNTTILFDERSKFQRVEVVDSASFGRCMLLDRVVQFCESDNHIYTRNMVDPALLPVLDSAPAALPQAGQQSPFHIQLIGGGDGWIASYLLDAYASRLPNLTISIVDIDPLVPKTTQRFFAPAGSSNSFTDPRVQWHHASAPDHLVNLPSHSADVVIIDCTDPSAEAARVLYTPSFYEQVNRVLVPGGKVTQQMNTDHEDYKGFLNAAEKTWTKAGLIGLSKWTEYVPSYGGRSVFWMAEKAGGVPEDEEEELNDNDTQASSSLQ